MKLKKLSRLAASLASGLVISSVASASVWVETGPPGAGDLLATAQTTFDSAFNPLTGITGLLDQTTPVGGTPLYQVDLYKIRISDFATFSAATVSGAPDDTALFLFDSTGLGVYMNDDNGTDLLSLLDPPGAGSNGIYYLGVALGGFMGLDGTNDVFDASGGPIVGLGALSGWREGFTAQFSSPFAYNIVLTGATNGELPEPGSIGLILAGGMAAWLSRRRLAVARPATSA